MFCLFYIQIMNKGVLNWIELYTSHSFISASAGELQLSLTRRERIRRKVDHMERERDDQLLEKKRIGRVTNKVREPDYRINMRRVNFRWQRGNKIGQ